MRKYVQDVCGKVSVYTSSCLLQRNQSLIYVKMRQVFLSYGPLPNLRALLFYGFALEDNPHDTLALTFEARRSSGIAWWQNKQAWPRPKPHGGSLCESPAGGLLLSGRAAPAEPASP